MPWLSACTCPALRPVNPTTSSERRDRTTDDPTEFPHTMHAASIQRDGVQMQQGWYRPPPSPPQKSLWVPQSSITKVSASSHHPEGANLYRHPRSERLCSFCPRIARGARQPLDVRARPCELLPLRGRAEHIAASCELYRSRGRDLMHQSLVARSWLDPKT